MTTVLTGAGGFLGWHMQALLRARGAPPPRRLLLSTGGPSDTTDAARLVNGADRLLHLAGVSRGPEDAVREGNVALARRAATALEGTERPPREIVFANSVQAGNGTPYGDGKARAAEILHDAAEKVGARFVDLHLPNLFGEHGRPDHNSVVATFCDRLARGHRPVVEVDRELTLLSAQTAAEFLLQERPVTDLAASTVRLRVSEVLAELVDLDAGYQGACLPELDRGWRRDLFNVLRSSGPCPRFVRDLTVHSDARGAFHEVVRSTGGGGQTSFSTTEPGVTRGQHVHRRKVERFRAVEGTGVLRLRRLLTEHVMEIPLDGDLPTAVDVPTLWTHSLVATGDRPLRTVLWVDEPFDPAHPDTFPEDV